MSTGLNLFLWSLLQLPGGGQQLATGQQQQVEVPPIYQVELKGSLSETWSSILRRGHQLALENQAQHFLVVIDSPGGEIELMKRLGDRIDEISRDIPTTCIVERQALSAGAYLAISAERLLMKPAASIGAAMPIMLGPGGMIPEMDEGIQEKMNSAFRAEFRNWAELHQRDGRIAEAFVDSNIELKWISLRGEQKLVNAREFQDLLQKGEAPHFLETICASGELLTLSAGQALKHGYCDAIIESNAEALAWLGMTNAPVVTIEANWSEALVNTIGSWSWLLMLAAAFFMVVAFNMPGMGAPEVAAVTCISVFMFHGYLLGLAEWTEVLLVAGGCILLAVEIFVLPGTIFAGALGGVMLLCGLVLSMQGFVLPDGAIESLSLRSNLITVLGILLGAPMLALLVVRRFVTSRAGSFLSTAPADDFSGPISQQVPLGQSGVCVTPLRPSGTVLIDGKRYDALSRGDFLEVNAEISVIGGTGPSLVVEAIQKNMGEKK